MNDEFAAVFALLRGVLEEQRGPLVVSADTLARYTMVGTKPSPFPQHKCAPMWFGEVRIGKAYVSLHLLPLYMSPPLLKQVSPSLKKRMQGKACFNFKAAPSPELLAELKQLVEAALKDWTAKQLL
jgi:hypothetical protein